MPLKFFDERFLIQASRGGICQREWKIPVREGWSAVGCFFFFHWRAQRGFSDNVREYIIPYNLIGYPSAAQKGQIIGALLTSSAFILLFFQGFK